MLSQHVFVLFNLQKYGSKLLPMSNDYTLQKWQIEIRLEITGIFPQRQVTKEVSVYEMIRERFENGG